MKTDPDVGNSCGYPRSPKKNPTNQPKNEFQNNKPNLKNQQLKE